LDGGYVLCVVMCDAVSVSDSISHGWVPHSSVYFFERAGIVAYLGELNCTQTYQSDYLWSQPCHPPQPSVYCCTLVNGPKFAFFLCTPIQVGGRYDVLGNHRPITTPSHHNIIHGPEGVLQQALGQHAKYRNPGLWELGVTRSHRILWSL
jgi:hypothetical protein